MDEQDDKDKNLERRVWLSFAGLLCVVISLVLSFIAPNNYLNWAVLVLALVCVVFSRRMRPKP